jgi:hypothetical protein
MAELTTKAQLYRNLAEKCEIGADILSSRYCAEWFRPNSKRRGDVYGDLLALRLDRFAEGSNSSLVSMPDFAGIGIAALCM